jgi:hypothetical protein
VVAAISAAFGAYRHVEVDEVLDVATDGSFVDLEPFGQIRGGARATGLEDDVDRDDARLQGLVAEFVQQPATLPWGNRSILFRDPAGHLVNLFTPLTAEAIARFDG